MRSSGDGVGSGHDPSHDGAPLDTRQWFEVATQGFLRVLDGLEGVDLTGPGLGEWDLRALLGHTTRAYTTLTTYLTQEPTHLVLPSPVAYYRAAADVLADPHQVAARGRQAGEALGDAPVRRAREIAVEVSAVVRGTRDRAVVDTPLGGMRFADYLPTRAFEVTVHGLDLARAASLQTPAELSTAAVPALQLAATVADGPQSVALLLALTGRQSLPVGFTVL